MLANQVPDVLPCLGPPVVHGGGEDQAEDGLLGPTQTLQKANVTPSQDRLQMGNWRQSLKKPGVCSKRKVPYDLQSCVPGLVQLEMLFTVELPQTGAIQGCSIHSKQFND